MLVEKFGPEDPYGIMDEVYELLIHKVNDYEGTVNEMTGFNERLRQEKGDLQ